MSLEILLRRKGRTVSYTSAARSSTSRISTSCDMNCLIPDQTFCFIVRVVLGRSKREEKRRSLIDFRVRPNPPTVFANDALYNCQSHPRSFEIARLVQPLKNSKKLAHVLHLAPRSVVPHEHDAKLVLRHLSHLNYRAFPLSRVLHRVRQQINEHLFHQSRIAFRAKQVPDLPFHLPPGTLCRKVLDRLPQNRVQRSSL